MGTEYNLGVGVDIESIDRFTNLDKVKNRNFLEKVYTCHELEYCYAMKNGGPHLAERFCGKEAVIKALTGIGHTGIEYNKIEITYSAVYAPMVSLPIEIKDVTLHLSVAHSGNRAIAFAVAVNRTII